MKKLLCFALAFVMLFALASCGGGKTPSGSGADKGVRYDKNGDLLYKPEDVGKLDDNVVHGIISPAPDQEWYDYTIAWKEKAYDFKYDYDAIAWEEREMKWISSFVSGVPYDIITNINYPTTVIKGLVEPLDDILPLDDERYFEKKYLWKGKAYGVKVNNLGTDFVNVSGVYGVWYNKDMFDDYGERTPLELWEKGEWTLDAFINAAKNLTIDTDRNGTNDIYGVTTWANQIFTIANGASTVTLTDDTGIELTWNTPAYTHGLEKYLECKPYMLTGDAPIFTAGRAAMFVERLSHARQVSHVSPEKQVNFESDWVPLPKGPDGEGYMGSIGGDAIITCIGKGAKNIEGAKVFICADIAKVDYVNLENTTSMIGVTAEQTERALTCKGKFINDCYSNIGSLEDQMWSFWTSIGSMGAKSAIEKFTNPFQKQIDLLLAETVITEQSPFKSLGLVDFEDDKVVLKELHDGIVSITSDPNEVISGSKSLKIKLVPANEYGPIAVTTSDDYSLPIGSNYKITFKAKAVGGTGTEEGTLLVEFRPSAEADVLSGATKVSGYYPVDLSDGVAEAEILIGVTDFYDDLQMVLIGGPDESEPDMAVIIDDFTIEKVSA